MDISPKQIIDEQDWNDWQGILSSTGEAAALGSSLGSIIPGIGTAIGTVLGVVLGFLGSLYSKGDNYDHAQRVLEAIMPRLTWKFWGHGKLPYGLFHGYVGFKEKNWILFRTVENYFPTERSKIDESRLQKLINECVAFVSGAKLIEYSPGNPFRAIYDESNNLIRYHLLVKSSVFGTPLYIFPEPLETKQKYLSHLTDFAVGIGEKLPLYWAKSAYVTIFGSEKDIPESSAYNSELMGYMSAGLSDLELVKKVLDFHLFKYNIYIETDFRKDSLEQLAIFKKSGEYQKLPKSKKGPAQSAFLDDLKKIWIENKSEEFYEAFESSGRKPPPPKYETESKFQILPILIGVALLIFFIRK